MRAMVVLLILVISPPATELAAALEGMTVTRESFEPGDKSFHLARDSQAVCLAPGDPAGTYTVEAVVKDTVKKVELRLKRHFTIAK